MKRYSFIIVTAVLACLYFSLLSSYSDRFRNIEEAYAEVNAVNLAQGIKAENLKNLLLSRDYVDNSNDAEFIAGQLAGKINVENSASNKKLKALSDLQKRSWQVPSSVIDSIGSPLFKERLRNSRLSLGIDEQFNSLNTSELPSIISLNEGNGKIAVSIKAKDLSAPSIKKFFRLNDTICRGVVVRLSKHYLDTMDNYKPTEEIIGYLKTDSDGSGVFEGLDMNSSYSVIPISVGHEYGQPKGTIGGNLAECSEKGMLECEFTQNEHRIRLFDALTLKQIREDDSMTIRSPKEFKKQMAVYLALFFVIWWLIYLLSLRGKRNMDRGVLSILMMLTGLCLLMMFSINDPLADKMMGVDMAHGIIAGAVLILLLQKVDFMKLYQDRLPVGFDVPLECLKWLIKPFRVKVSYLTETLADRQANVLRKIGALLLIFCCLPFLILDLVCLTRLSGRFNKFLDRLPKGSGYIMVALLLTALLFTPLGVAVGGMRVNLNLGILFQPSEIAKYLIIIFMAAYFCVNANNIIKYSEKGNTTLFASKMKMMLSIIIGLGILMGLYLVLGDMGPSLVMAITFIIMYSVIKSKIDLDGLSDSRKMTSILTCDLAMLTYGIISFIVFLIIGGKLASMGLGCLAWFVIWILIGVSKKQVFESPIMFNLILSAFIFGGSILSGIPALETVGERLESRNEMCTNTWGTLPVDGMAADAGENTQVAEGLWGLASGGLFGQGLGSGSPQFIPAYHTDMILESVGEQLGFAGILAIILLLALLLRRTVVLGYRTSHPFTFYLCLGVAVVTAVQFIIISLGSTGIIPLTGVTVPFFSYGKVSMILNLTTFGIILSISSNNTICADTQSVEAVELNKRNIGKYNYSVSVLSLIYCLVAIIIAGVFIYYQVIGRNATLIRPVYVNNASGIPVIEYNPRIDEITKKMYAGDIYDRNGVLLATSEQSKLKQYENVYSKYGLNDEAQKGQQRFYPFREHLYFILGDYNSKLFFSSSEKSPRGYMAEARHLAELRGYENVLRDEFGVPVKADLVSDEFTPGRYYSANYTTVQRGIQLRDYSALIPYLKAGVNSSKIDRTNERDTHFWEFGSIKPKDIQMTIDAELQTKLQQRIPEYIADNFRTGKWINRNAWNKLRISVVILDAEKGDLLASANYPLPDYETLKTAPDSYSDNYKDKTWKAYTERDLGMTRPTAPGSTAKVMSALAGLRKEGIAAANPLDKRYSYYVDPAEKVGLEPAGTVTMRDAIVESSNCYFISLVNDYNLYDDLAYIYGEAGVELKGDMSYCIDHREYSADSDWADNVKEDAGAAVESYIRYRESGKKTRMYGHPAWFWAWGQGTLWATPLTMARVSSIVANNGKMPVTRYVMDQKPEEVDIVGALEAKSLNVFMKEEAKAKGFSDLKIGGKTGTAERDLWNARGRKVKDAPNDGWFICYIEDARISSLKDGRKSVTESSPLAVAVRMERLGSGMSGQAVRLTKEVVVSTLREQGYLE